MGYWTFRRSPTIAIWVALCLAAFTCGALLVASHDDQSSKRTAPAEKKALQELQTDLHDQYGNLNSWVETSDPCGDWMHVECEEDDTPAGMDQNFRHVTALRLLNLNLSGQLNENIGNLPAMRYFDVMWNRLNGSLPAAIGRLEHVRLLLFNGNEFSGSLPAELGNLGELQRLQVDENKFSGTIPSTFSNLKSIVHLHMNNNSLTGTVPSGFSLLPKMLHVLVDNNRLSGPLPADLASAPSLTIIQLDNNQFTSIPTTYTRMPRLMKLSMRNCSLSGTLPNFNASTSLQVLDLSHNSLTGSLSSLDLPVNMTSVDLSYNSLQGAVPQTFGNLQNLSYLELRNNNLSGDIPSNLGLGSSFNKSTPVIVDFQENSLRLAPGSPLVTAYLAPGHQVQVWLSGNPVDCPPNPGPNPFCVPTTVDSYLNLDVPESEGNSGGNFDCSPCSAPEQLRPPPFMSPDTYVCSCAIPIFISYRLKSPPFAIFDVYETVFRESIAAQLNVDMDQIEVNSTEYQVGPRIKLGLLIFPAAPAKEFNGAESRRILIEFYNWNVDEDPEFGPYEILGINPPASSPSSGSSGMSTGAIVGIVCGAVLAAATVSALLVYCCMKRRGYGTVLGRSKRATPIHVPGVRSFTFAEMTKATRNFRDDNLLGVGGYGKVYFGVLEDGQKVAVKRAEEGSLQGSTVFENEIQLLSRVHHRNLVGLVGYCNDDGEHINGEQMLVYEFVPNGSLYDHLAPGTYSDLDLTARLRIAICAARGVQYLHTQADPPIFHRDIKAANILLDGKYNAKVSDFGLSKLAMGDADLEGVHTGHVTTVVKGTPGYLDPDYFLTHQLTDRSDVYSFGVVLLELISGRRPITNGKNLTREVNAAYREGDIVKMLDPKIGLYSMNTIEPLLKLALACVDSETSRRPSMTDVLRELEEIWKEAPWSDVGDHSRELWEEFEPGDKSGKQKFRHARYSNLSSPGSSPVSPSGPLLYNSSSVKAESDLISSTNMSVFPR